MWGTWFLRPMRQSTRKCIYNVHLFDRFIGEHQVILLQTQHHTLYSFRGCVDRFLRSCNQGLVVCFHSELFAINVMLKAFTEEHNSKELFFNLSIILFCSRQSSVRIVDWPTILKERRVDPRPYWEASHCMVMFLLTSKYCKSAALMTRSLIFLKASFWGCSQHHSTSFFS